MPDAGDAGSVVVVGGGLAGALTAVLLGQRGDSVEVLERRSDPRLTGADRGRSINLAISARGLAALAAVGLEEEIRALAIPLGGRMIHAPDGRTSFQAYGRRGQAINSVSRSALNQTLLEAADRHPGVRLEFDRRCIGVDPALGVVTTVGATGEDERTHQGRIVIGADGAFSAVRQQFQRRERYDYSQAWLAHGYKELVIPPADGGGFAMNPGALHIWPRGGFMMMAMPNLDQSFTVTLYLAFEGERASFEALREPGAVERFFRREFPDAVPLMPALEADFAANPTGTLVTVRSRPWHEGRVVLVGDACHAIVPFFGQGANAAFEDVIALGGSLTRHAEPRKAFVEYEDQRRRHTDAIADLALANFEEMRDHVASWRFRWRKRLEQALHALLPRSFVPLYTMISFTTIPYADARDRARRQDRAIRLAGVVAGLVLVAALILLLRG